MDEMQRRKFRAVGALAILVMAVLSVFFVFYNVRAKKNASIMLHSFYSDMVQTMQFSINMNGTPDSWGWIPGYKNADLIQNNIVGNLRVSKNCVKEMTGCFPDVPYKTLGGRPTKVNFSKLPSVKMTNGITFAFETIGACKHPDEPCAFIYVDLNGIDSPNMFGQDLFVFNIINSASIPFVPFGYSLSPTLLITNNKYGCNKTSDMAMYCSSLISIKGWSIDKNYPW